MPACSCRSSQESYRLVRGMALCAHSQIGRVTPVTTSALSSWARSREDVVGSGC